MVDCGIGGGDGGCGGEVIDFDLSRLLSDTAISVGDGEVDVIYAVIEEFMGDVLSDYWLGVVA